jgi:hypothetical protein
MENTLEDIFTQATSDSYSVKMNGVGYSSVILYGIKIIKDTTTKEIEILNTINNLYYYHKMTEDEVNIFLNNGWRNGVYELSLKKYILKLELIESRVRDEISGKNSKKNLKVLHRQREETIGRYNEIKNKLNK